MEIRKVGREAAVDLFGKGIMLLPRAQAGFDVPNRNVIVIRSERAGKGRGRVPLHKHQVRAFVPQDPVEPCQAGRRHLGKILPRLHHPLLKHKRFALATHDRFFIVVETLDAKFSAANTRTLLESTGCKHIEEVTE